MPVKSDNVKEDGDVRLQGGANRAEGRVEVYHSGAWGTVCDDGFDLADANVICRQLGFPSANASHCCAHFSHGSGVIALDDLACVGTEGRLIDCPHRGWGEHNCAHTEDASVTCNGNIRLAGSNSTLEGRVEVYKDSNWVTICDEGWDKVDGDVVCRQLGFPGANETYAGARYGPGTGPVLLSNVQCGPDETEFFNCTMTTPPPPTCNHSQDASVKCRKSLRLTNGRSPMEGYVEVYDGFRWRPICAQNWGIVDARVVCSQIGDLAAIEATDGMRFGQSSQSYLMSNVGCTGQEAALDECPFTDTGDADCQRFAPAVGGDSTLLNNVSNLAGVRCSPAVRLVGNSNSSFLEGAVQVYVDGAWGYVCADQWDKQDASVVCRQLGEYPLANSCCKASSKTVNNPVMAGLGCLGTESRLQDCPPSSQTLPMGCLAATAKCQVTVRLIGGRHSLEGNVEIIHNGEWGNICDDNWGLEDAKVVCRQLGNYEVVSHSCCSKHAPPTRSYHLDDVGCSGTESRLEDCYHSDWGTHNCGTSEAAGVSCRNLRLVSEDISASSPKGRVEVVHNGRWGRVCGDNWDIKDANVLCRQLYNSTAEALGSFQAGTGVGFMTNLGCTGTETMLQNCSYTPIERDCETDATVICRGGLRLVGGRTPLEGRVEIFHDGQWGTVCDDSWDLNDAMVVCRQLGNYAALTAKCCQAYGPGAGPILMDGVDCDGTESILENCPHEGWLSHNCQHYEDASVVCTDIKLSYPNGTTSTSLLGGRVEILIDNEWQSICNKDWDEAEAQVVCRQLFDTDVKNVTFYPALEGKHTGMTDVRCRGNESMLSACPSKTSGVVCTSKWRAGVQCKDSKQESDIRLVGGSRPSEGVVETLVDGDWGLICGLGWDMADGAVACRQLGFCSVIETMRGWNDPIDERNLMHWHSLNCSGREERLRDCHKEWGSFPCSGYNFEGAVRCKNWCDPPDFISHGTWSPRRTQYKLGSKITFRCDEGYELNGSRTLSCLSVCEWGSAEPKCEKSSNTGGGTSDERTGGSPGSGIHPAGIFFIGLLVGVLVVVIAGGLIWCIKREAGHKNGTQLRAGNIFRPRGKNDEMEQPVLFSSMNNDHEEMGEPM
ncbi:scavenger receptor cysteine-rich domain superfamily protein-like [Diadema antillarum]|uniref:scavenger receptor cysteine-rich domain superfamily protein-like n=1 Tax=Diadema antillarum TaxID=105358 RepID=UPI003A85CA98